MATLNMSNGDFERPRVPRSWSYGSSLVRVYGHPLWNCSGPRKHAMGWDFKPFEVVKGVRGGVWDHAFAPPERLLTVGIQSNPQNANWDTTVVVLPASTSVQFIDVVV